MLPRNVHFNRPIYKRKTWGYWQYKRGTPIPLLMVAFGHATQQQTLTYLGIQTKDVQQIYDMEL